MAVGHLFLYFLACGAATFPLTLIVLRVLAGLSGYDAHHAGQVQSLRGALPWHRQDRVA